MFLWQQVITKSGSSEEMFVKMVFILSHGNAYLSRWFSVNSECLIDSQEEQALIAQRQILRWLGAGGGIKTSKLTTMM